MNDHPVRVRIAPSPTGYLHVGTARTAIFNYLFARHYGGQFLVRIEDTDAERSKPELIQPILDSLEWLGLSVDEEIIYQSQRLDKYGDYAQQILTSGQGYRCFCSQAQLQADREKARAEKTSYGYNRRCLDLSDDEVQAKLDQGEKFTIRLKIPDGRGQFDDMVSGNLSRDNQELEDFIIARSDGSATYNLAVVIDDHDMGITHVIRGNDHVTNTFKQLHIYRALGYDAPRFGHVPLILRPDKKKVSKRLGDADIAEFRDKGILPQALFNYLSLLGWSSKDDREIYTVEKLIEVFTEANFNPSNAVFDPEKLSAFNREHIIMMPDHELAAMVAPMLVAADLTSKYWLETRWDYLCAVIRILKERVKKVSDFVAIGPYFFDSDFGYDAKAAGKHFNTDSAQWLTTLADRFEGLDAFDAASIEAALSGLADELEIKKAKLIHPTRLATTGVPAGPSLYELLELLSQPVVVERMKRAAGYINDSTELS
jgi:glutamyl-tRNA synthetase